MSIIPVPQWINRKRRPLADYYMTATGQLEVNNFRLPEHMMTELDQALADDRRQAPLGTPEPRRRTARVISDEIEHLRHELSGARKLVAQGEAKEAALVAELTMAVDGEIAAKKATHDADVAELESLRPVTGEPS